MSYFRNTSASLTNNTIKANQMCYTTKCCFNILYVGCSLLRCSSQMLSSPSYKVFRKDRKYFELLQLWGKQNVFYQAFISGPVTNKSFNLYGFERYFDPFWFSHIQNDKIASFLKDYSRKSSRVFGSFSKSIAVLTLTFAEYLILYQIIETFRSWHLEEFCFLKGIVETGHTKTHQ